VAIYVALGGVRGTIYNQVLQLALIVAGLSPLLWLKTTAFIPAGLGSARGHLWNSLVFFSPRAEFDQFGVVLGLGFVLSFSYWCTDFVQIQRALAAKSIAAGRLVPLLAGFGKIGFSLLVVAPALGAAAFLGPHLPRSFDQTLPALMVASYSPALLALGLTALLASLMSTLASNVSAFSAIWTEEIYRTTIRRGASEAHYLRVGRFSSAAAVAISLAASYVAFGFRDILEYIQMIFSLFGAPFFAVFLLGIFTRRTTSRGAIAGLLSGSLLAAVHHSLRAAGVLTYGSPMNADFHVAAYAFFTSMFMGLLFSKSSERKSEAELRLLVYHRKGDDEHREGGSVLCWLLAGTLLGCCALLNYLWR
jgi:SSS family solute:Na+ symporter